VEFERKFRLKRAAARWLRWSFAGISPWRTGFDHKTVHFRFGLDRVVMGEVFLSVLKHFSFPLSVPFHHCYILIHPSTTHTL